jgi:uncharacterized Ntn-hydrolase superfamily protein
MDQRQALKIVIDRDQALAEVERLRAAARAVTLSASPRSPDGQRRSVDAAALFALDELAIDHGVAPTYVSVKADEVERLRAIEERARLLLGIDGRQRLPDEAEPPRARRDPAGLRSARADR